MATQDLEKLVNDNFSKMYNQYRSFMEKVEYKAYWDLCIKSINDPKFLSGVIFCNDVMTIPPVKVFLSYYKNELIRITNDPLAVLPLFINRSLGAFWSMIFKCILNYSYQEVIRINENFYFHVKTASYYFK